MRLRAIVFVIGFSLGSSGCAVVRYGAIDLTVPPAQVLSRWKNRVYECQSAKEAWKQFAASCPEKQFSDAFGNGFKKGYREFLDAGGNGYPPGAPPTCYRTTHSETPAGRTAIVDWYAGYQQGAAVAQATGLRAMLVVPPSDMLRNSVVAPLKNPADGAQSDLPPPRKLPEPDDAMPEPDAGAAAAKRGLPPRPVPAYTAVR